MFRSHRAVPLVNSPPLIAATLTAALNTEYARYMLYTDLYEYTDLYDDKKLASVRYKHFAGTVHSTTRILGHVQETKEHCRSIS